MNPLIHFTGVRAWKLLLIILASAFIKANTYALSRYKSSINNPPADAIRANINMINDRIIEFLSLAGNI
jgi:hypothetical protein